MSCTNCGGVMGVCNCCCFENEAAIFRQIEYTIDDSSISTETEYKELPGGVFLAMMEDGVRDRLLMPQTLLKRRFDLINTKNQNPDGTTHIMFKNASFKPFKIQNIK